MKFELNEPKQVIKDNLDYRWKAGTIYNHYENPVDFMQDVIDNQDKAGSSAKKYIEEGILKYGKIDQKNIEYDKKYLDVALKVKNKLIARGFTTKMLYADVEFTSQNTGVLSKQRVLLGKRDCYFKNASMTDGKLFHDIYINLSYSWEYSDSEIEKNSYALYALVKELSRLIPIRVFVINHVGHNTKSKHTNEQISGTCYSYVLKRFGLPINPKEFLFFTADSKRTFGWASYDIVTGNNSQYAEIGRPNNTVSIAEFNLDKEIDNIWEKFQQSYPNKFI